MVRRDIEGTKLGTEALKMFFQITMLAVAKALFRALATRFVTLSSFSPLTPNSAYLYKHIVLLSCWTSLTLNMGPIGFTLSQATKDLRESRSIALLYF